MRRAFAFLFLLLFGFHPVVHAQQKDELQIRDAAEFAMKLADPVVGDSPVKALRRTDLEIRLFSVGAKAPAEQVYFYDEEAAPRAFNPYSFRLVAVARSTREIYRLSGFEAPRGPYEPLLEFNRLTSTLQLSIAKERAISLAELFLDSAVPGAPGEIAKDEDAVGIRLAVQNQYLSAYGDVWRALESYAGWWHQFKAVAPDLSPVVAVESSGSYQVTLKRLVCYAGREPEVQNWQLEVSRNGEVRVLAMQTLFPAHQGWIFYDYR